MNTTETTTMETYNFDDSGNTVTNADDRFYNMTTEQIKTALESERSDMINVCMNLTSDFNKSSVIRANNAFLGKEVIIVGKRRFDRRGAVGSHHYETIKHSLEIEPVIAELKASGYTVFAVDNTEAYNPQSVYKADIPEKSAFIYGEEQQGLSEDTIRMCDSMIYIPQYGSVRSINVAQAAAVIMGEYNRRYKN